MSLMNNIFWRFHNIFKKQHFYPNYLPDPLGAERRAEAAPPRELAGAADQHRARRDGHLPPDVRDPPGDPQGLHPGGGLHTPAGDE